MGRDDWVDRRSLRRKLTFWRFLGILLVAVVLIGTASLVLDRAGLFHPIGDQIAKIEVDGVITSETGPIEKIRKLAEDEQVLGVIVAIDSPGGTTAGGEALYEALRALAEKKPLVATIDTVGTSAAYLAAVASDQIFVRRSTITGSIGVIYQSPNVSVLLDRMGIGLDQVRSSPLKASPDPFTETDEAELAVIRDLLKDSYDWFAGTVKMRRGFDEAMIEKIADGRVFSGIRAVELNLVDQIGNVKSAKDWLITTHNLPEDIRVIDHKIDETEQDGLSMRTVIGLLLGWIFDNDPNFSGAGNAILGIQQLDGLVSLWHAAPSN